MSANEARAAITAQECAHMNQHHGARLLKDLPGLDLGFDLWRVVCVGIDGRRFTWQAYEACGLCGSTGDIIGVDSKAYACPNCEDLCCETFTTDYDGNDVRMEA